MTIKKFYNLIFLTEAFLSLHAIFEISGIISFDLHEWQYSSKENCTLSDPSVTEVIQEQTACNIHHACESPQLAVSLFTPWHSLASCLQTEIKATLVIP